MGGAGSVYLDMGSSSTLIGLWATGVWTVDLGMTSAVSALTISGFACQPSTLGMLNNLIGTCYSGSGYSGPGTVNYDVVPFIGKGELAILEQMYLVSYYNSLANATMGNGGLGLGGLPPASLADGDTKISYQNAAAIGQSYIKQAQQSTMNMRFAVSAYLNNALGSNLPRSVSYPDIYYPIWGQDYIGMG